MHLFKDRENYEKRKDAIVNISLFHIIIVRNAKSKISKLSLELVHVICNSLNRFLLNNILGIYLILFQS